MNSDLRRALRFIVPYWRRLALVLALSLPQHRAVALPAAPLARLLRRRAARPRPHARSCASSRCFAAVTVASFAVNVVSGLRYTRVSADILFDMRLEMYRHLQRLSPRFYARTRLGDIMSRINNDIGEIQRIAAETALAWVGNVLFLAGTMVMLAWLDVRLFLLTVATAPFGVWALVRYRTRLEGEVAALRQRSADIGSFLIETHPGDEAGGDVERAGARGRRDSASRNAAFVRGADVDAAADVPVGRPARPDPVGRNRRGVRLRRHARHRRQHDGRHVRRVHGLPDAVPAAAAGADGDVREPGHRSRLAAPRVGDSRSSRSRSRNRRPRCRCRRCAATIEFEDVTLSFDRGAPVARAPVVLGRRRRGRSRSSDRAAAASRRSPICCCGCSIPTRRRSASTATTCARCGSTDLRRRVALVDQEPCILHATIAENIRYARPGRDATRRSADAARQAALDAIHRRPAAAVRDGGRRARDGAVGRRAAAASRCARAFLTNPAVLDPRRADGRARSGIRAQHRRRLRSRRCAAGRRSSSPIAASWRGAPTACDARVWYIDRRDTCRARHVCRHSADRREPPTVSDTCRHVIDSVGHFMVTLR